MIFDVKIDFGTFWQLPLIKNSKFINFFWVCWFLLGKNPSNFVSPVWKLLNPYCHTIAECLYLTLDFAIVFKKSYHVFYSIFIFFLFFSRKVAHHRHFTENLSKVWLETPHNLFGPSPQIRQLLGIFLKEALFPCPLSMSVLYFCIFIFSYSLYILFF